MATTQGREKIFLQEPELKLPAASWKYPRGIPYAWIFLISLAAGSLGGFAAGFLFWGKTAGQGGEAPLQETREWVLRDEKGKPQGILGLNNGRWTFSWGGAGQESRLILQSSEKSGPLLQLVDASGQARVMLGGLPGGGGGLQISQAGGQEGIDLSVSPEGNPVLRMNHEEQGARVKLGISSDGTKGLFFYRNQDDPDAVFMQAGNEPPVVGTLAARQQKPSPSLNEAVREAQRQPVEKVQRPPIQKIETIRGIFSETVEHCDGLVC